MATSIVYTPQAIDLDTIKAFCRVDGTGDDTLLTFLYEAACEEAMSYAHVVLGSATITADTVWVSSYELPTGPWVLLLQFMSPLTEPVRRTLILKFWMV